MPKCYSCTHYRGGFCELNGTHSFTGEICSSYEDEYASAEKKITREELRRTKRALWLARAEVARISAQNWANSINTLTYYCGKFDNKEIEPREMMEKWQWVERKCRAKAEGFL